MIYVPRKKNIILPGVVSTPIQGYFHVYKLKASTREVVQELHFPNLITDDGLDEILQIGIAGGSNLELDGEEVVPLARVCGVGTGTTSPSFTDTGLESLVAWTNDFGPNNGDTGYGPNNEYGYEIISREFSEGEAEGNLTEVGFYSSLDVFGTPDENELRTLFNRQLFRDENGDPTTITVLSDEILQIQLELRKYIPTTSDQTTQLTISGSTYNITYRPANVAGTSLSGYWTNFSLNGLAGVEDTEYALARELDELVSIDSEFNGDECSIDSVRQSYTSGNYYRDIECQWDPDDGNFDTGIGSIIYAGSKGSGDYGWQMKLDPKIPKTDTERLILQFRHSVSRVT